MAELVDALVSEASGVTPVEVQILFRAQINVLTARLNISSN